MKSEVLSVRASRVPAESDADVSTRFIALESVTVVDFAHVTSKPKPPDAAPPLQTTGLNPTRHGNWAQWAAVMAAILIGAVSICLTLSFHSSEKAATSSDEHVRQLVQPSIDSMNNGIGSRLDKINDKLTDLTGKVEHVQGQVDELNLRAKKIATEQDGLRKRVDGQEAIIHLQDPNRILATIQGEIQIAEKANEQLPPSRLAEYRNALRALPEYKSASPDLGARLRLHYWLTVAAIINYQSLLNQLSGEAPDPAKVASPCMTGTIASVFSNMNFANCVVELDTNAFQNVLFENSVVRYRGGPVALANVSFVNCRFVLQLAAQPAKPAQEKLLLAILDSPDQKTVRISR